MRFSRCGCCRSEGSSICDPRLPEHLGIHERGEFIADVGTGMHAVCGLAFRLPAALALRQTCMQDSKGQMNTSARWTCGVIVPSSFLSVTRRTLTETF